MHNPTRQTRFWLYIGAAIPLGLIACGNLRGKTSTAGAASDFGVMTGHLAFTPPLANADIASVDAVGADQTVTPGTVAPDGDFVIYPLTAQTYTVTATCPGYAASPIVGVAVTDGADIQLPVTIQMTSTGDAGPTPDAHVDDDRGDAGP